MSLLTFGLATLLALYLAPPIIRAAERYGIVDHPNSPLKTQAKPVAYLGGLVVFCAMLCALALTYPFDREMLALLLAAAMTVAVGLVDDLGTLTPRDKMVGQILTCAILVKAGVSIQVVGWPPLLGGAMTVLWLVTTMNAFNILDVSDGLAASTATAAAGMLALYAWLTGDAGLTVVALATAGATLGFLRVNKQPARMYLGDTGSMLLGLLLGAMAMRAAYDTHNAVASLVAPLTFLAAPLFDLVFVILVRLKKRLPVHHGSPDHVAIRLKAAGWSARGVAWLAGIASAAVASAGIGLTYLSDTHAMLGGAGLVVFALGLMLFIAWRYPAPVRGSSPVAPASPEPAP